MTSTAESTHHGPPVEVCVAANDLEAQVVKSFLESNGIPVMLQGDAVSKVYGFTIGGMAEVRVFVPDALAAKAIELLESGGEEEEEEEDEDELPLQPVP